MPEPPEPKLKRELGLRDLTLFAIACIVGVRFIPSAAHAGPGTVTLWLLAGVCFVAPLAVTIGALCVKYPGNGAFYLWTRKDFGPWHGFLCFWVYWIGIAFWFPSAAMFFMSVACYAAGPSYAYLAENRLFLVAASLITIWIALGTNLIGMKIGKWTENIGAASIWVIGFLFSGVAAFVWAKRGSATPLHLLPEWSWGTLNLGAATIAYAVTGLELAALMSGEIRDPERNLPRAGWIASTFATVFYAGMTLALLILLPAAQISERQGMAQAGEIVASILGTPWLAPGIAILIVLSGMGQFGGLGTGASRLPFAVGVDRLLPAAFAKIHPRWGTPYISILILGAIGSLLLVVFQLGDTMRAAYDSLVSMMVIAGFIPYLYIFGSAWKAGKRFSAIGGWAVTVIALVCSVIPTVEVNNVWLFEAKLTLATLALIASGWFVYRRHQP